MNKTRRKQPFELILVISPDKGNAYDLCIDDKKIGMVEELPSSSPEEPYWHAYFEHSFDSKYFLGEGPTPIKAIRNAFILSRKRYKKALADLADLQVIMFPLGDDETAAE